MPINRPVTKTVISTTQWGIPITDEVNALRTELNALKPTAWTGITTFQNGWVSIAIGQPCQYRKIGDTVHLRGEIGGGTLNSIAFTLPTGFRPPFYLQTAVYGNNGAAQVMVSVIVNADGRVGVYGANGAVGMYLSFSVL